MSDKDGGPVGNRDNDKRGRSLPRQDRESEPHDKEKGRGERGKVGYGDVTQDPKKD
jgi:hypothetical protein